MIQGIVKLKSRWEADTCSKKESFYFIPKSTKQDLIGSWQSSLFQKT